MVAGAHGNRTLSHLIYIFIQLHCYFPVTTANFLQPFRFGQCSRTCGGGVQSSIRDCNAPSPANGGKYCIGTRIKYRSCNMQDCLPDTLDFREQQCADMNNNNFDITGLDKNVRWVPKYGQSPHDECKLFCRVEKSNNYFLLNEKVRFDSKIIKLVMPIFGDSFFYCCWSFRFVVGERRNSMQSRKF